MPHLNQEQYNALKEIVRSNPELTAGRLVDDLESVYKDLERELTEKAMAPSLFERQTREDYHQAAAVWRRRRLGLLELFDRAAA